MAAALAALLPIGTPSGVDARGPADGTCQERLFDETASPRADCVELETGTVEATLDALPSGFTESIVFSTGLENPTNIEFAADGRVFVAEKSGTLKVYDSVADPTPTAFTDLKTNVHNFWDRGLLGLALDPSLTNPALPSRPWVYVLYTYDHVLGGGGPVGSRNDGCPTPPGATADGCVVSGRLSRFSVSGSTISGPETVLIEDWCQQYPSHSVGALGFGPDGALYVSAGDGASFNNVDYGQYGGTLGGTPTPKNPCGDPPADGMAPPTAEGGALRSQDLRTEGPTDPATLDGAVLRVDPITGAAHPGNPFASSSDPNKQRVIAYGLRNPFRFEFRPGTDELWVGDVGWSAREEINRIADANDATVENFGWPCYEGLVRSPGYDGADLELCEDFYAEGSSAMTTAVYQYAHSGHVVANETCPTGSSSTTGIAFYPETGGTFPAAYRGGMFFADHSRNCIWWMAKGSNGQPDPATRAVFLAPAANPVDLEIGLDGALYYADFDSNSIRRVMYSSNQPPTAVAAADPTSGAAPLTVEFDGTGSSDPEEAALSYAWDLDDDGAFDNSTSPTPTRVYSSQASVTVRLRVTDPAGLADTDTVQISVANTPPVPTIQTPSNGTKAGAGQQVTFSGSASDAQDGNLAASRLSWLLRIQHCPDSCHAHDIETFAGVASGAFVAPDHEYPSHLELILTATDSNGASNSVTRQIDYRTVPLEFRSVPSGLSLTVNGTASTTPFTRTVIQGSANSVSATTPQTVGSTTYSFASWSDSGAATHTITAGAAAATYTATYSHPDVTAPSGSVTIAGGRAVTATSSVTLAVPATDADSSVSEVELSNDGIAFTNRPYASSQPWTLPATNGTRTVYVRWKDTAGNWSAVKTDTIVLDTVAPTATEPRRGLVAATTIDAGRSTLRVPWSGADATSGIARYELLQSTDGGPWTVVSTTLTSPTADRSLASLHTYRFRVRPVDKAGNVGAWVFGSPFWLARYSEFNRAIAYTGSWTTVSDPAAYWGGAAKRSATAGAQATLSFTGRAAAWVARTGPNRGVATVYVNGTQVATVNLNTPAYQNQRVVWARNWSTSAARTVTIRVAGTPGHPLVDVDAFVSAD